MKKYKLVSFDCDDIYHSPLPVSIFCIFGIALALFCIYACPFLFIKFMFFLILLVFSCLLFINSFEVTE